MLEIYLLGDSGTGVGKLDREGKEAKTDCVNERIIAVGSCGSVPLGISRRWRRARLRVLPPKGPASRCLSTNSHLRQLRGAPKDINSTPFPPPTHTMRACPAQELSMCLWLEKALRKRVTGAGGKRSQPLRCSVCTGVNQSLPRSGGRQR